MAKNKAPRPDGFMSKFYQETQSFTGKDILEVVEESRQNQKVSPGLNSTFIALIPKMTKSKDPQGFQPISLCIFTYKIISTVIVKRLKHLLPDLISLEKTGFMEGRQIVDGIITSQKILHSLKHLKTLV